MSVEKKRGVRSSDSVTHSLIAASVAVAVSWLSALAFLTLVGLVWYGVQISDSLIALSIGLTVVAGLTYIGIAVRIRCSGCGAKLLVPESHENASSDSELVPSLWARTVLWVLRRKTIECPHCGFKHQIH